MIIDGLWIAKSGVNAYPYMGARSSDTTKSGISSVILNYPAHGWGWDIGYESSSFTTQYPNSYLLAKFLR